MQQGLRSIIVIWHQLWRTIICLRQLHHQSPQAYYNQQKVHLSQLIMCMFKWLGKSQAILSLLRHACMFKWPGKAQATLCHTIARAQVPTKPWEALTPHLSCRSPFPKCATANVIHMPYMSLCMMAMKHPTSIIKQS